MLKRQHLTHPVELLQVPVLEQNVLRTITWVRQIRRIIGEEPLLLTEQLWMILAELRIVPQQLVALGLRHLARSELREAHLRQLVHAVLCRRCRGFRRCACSICGQRRWNILPCPGVWTSVSVLRRAGNQR